MNTGLKTPWNPSQAAMDRVKNPLPPHTQCPFCGAAVEIVNNSVIYGRSYGDWPWSYRCVNDFCDSYVGMHPYTAIPLGTLANRPTREARKQAKAAFTRAWQDLGLTRSQGYVWLAEQLGMEDKEQCHVGWFDQATCARVVQVCLAGVSDRKRGPIR